MYLSAGLTFVGLAAGNFIWQFFRGKNWSQAVERSYFQGFAIGVYLLATAN